MKRLLKEKEKKYRHKLYEATVLKEIQDRINYSLDIEKVIDIIASNLENLIPYSTASSLLLKNDKLIFNTKVKEPVNTAFITRVKNNCLASLLVLLNEPLPAEDHSVSRARIVQKGERQDWAGLPKLIEEKQSGAPLNENNNSTLSSFFNIPLIVNEKIQGIINISSTHQHFYKEEEMTIVYKIADLATHALSRLQEISIREKGKLISLITSLKDGVFMVDTNSQITVINKTAKDFLDLQKDNPTITQLLASLPNSYNFVDKIEKAITLNQKIEEKDVQHNTGKTLNITITPVLDVTAEEEPKVIGASFLIQDVTLEKSLSKMKEDFTNIIVHELRSPLTSIKASTEMLTEQNNLTEEDKKRLINIISNQTIKMLDEVATILDAAKLDTGLFSVRKTNGDFKKVIEDTIEAFRMVARNKSVNLVSHIDPFLPPAQFDNHHMRRVISNLLTNSFKFTPSGGTVTLRAWLAPRSLGEVGATPEKIFVSVSDPGSGIPKDKQYLLFSKFTQIRNANGAIGTGLGLYVAKGIIEAHNGTISLESEPNKGTTITFNIPADTTLQPPQTLPAGLSAETQALENSPSEKPINTINN